MFDTDDMTEYNDYHSEMAEANAREAADYDRDCYDDEREDHMPDMCDIHFGGD